MDAAFRESITPLWQESLFNHLGVTLNAALVKEVFGMFEIICALLLYTQFRELSAILLCGMMSGMALTHLFLGELGNAAMPLLLFMGSLVVCHVGGGPANLQGGPPKYIPGAGQAKFIRTGGQPKFKGGPMKNRYKEFKSS